MSRAGEKSARFLTFSIILVSVHHTWYLVLHRPVPSSGSLQSIFSWLQMSLNKGLSKGLYRLEIRFSDGSASGRWNSGIQSHWLYKSPFWRLQKTWKSGKWHLSYLSSVSWNSDISESIFLLPGPKLPKLSFHPPPDKWSSDLWQMLFCPYPEHTS